MMRVDASTLRERRPACARNRPRVHSQSGLALIAVLWLTVLLTVIASGFAFSMRSEVLAARNALSVAQARAAADGAVERMFFELLRPREIPEVWRADGAGHAWQDHEAAITAVAVDESAKIDLNAAPDALLKGLLQNVGGQDAETAQRLVEAIADWRDADDLRRPNGAEAADYRAAGLKYGPANGQFAVVGELQRVLGMTPALFARIGDSLTVHSRRPGINVATASRDALLAIPGTTAEMIDAFIAQRSEARASKLPLPPFPAAQGFATGAAAVWRIRAQATMPDGVTFVREAVVRPSPDPRRAVVTLLWQEGTLLAPPNPAGNANEADPAAVSTNGLRNR
jgi:general secretion pathway protein K